MISHMAANMMLHMTFIPVWPQRLNGGFDLENTLDVLRQEKKYRISYLQAVALMRKLSLVLPQDSHNGTGGYMVRSLYFDTPRNTDFLDKEDGLEERKKLRLRIYSPSDTHVKLELKEKFNTQQRKRSLRLGREQARQLIAGDAKFLREIPGTLAHTLYCLFAEEVYRPVCMIEYSRFAYIVPTNDIRITFDMKLAASESGTDLFAPQPMLYPVGMPDDVTLEVKYNRFLLSYVKDALAESTNLPVAYSKYCQARYVSHLPDA